MDFIISRRNADWLPTIILHVADKFYARTICEPTSDGLSIGISFLGSQRAMQLSCEWTKTFIAAQEEE